MTGKQNINGSIRNGANGIFLTIANTDSVAAIVGDVCNRNQANQNHRTDNEASEDRLHV